MPNSISESLLKEFPLGFANDGTGDPLVPLDPHIAKARLAERELQPGYTDALLNVRHPLHDLYTRERRGLEQAMAMAKRKA